MTLWLWLSTERMTVGVAVDDNGIIVQAPPIVAKFKGQTVAALLKWIGRQPGLHAKWLDV